MSSFTSTSSSGAGDAPAAYHRRQLWCLGLVLGLGLAVVAGVAAWVDPYGRFRNPAPKAMPQGFGLDSAMFYMTQFHRITPAECAAAEVVLLGESRVMPLTNSQKLSDFQGRRIMNLAYPGASWEEALTPLAERQGALSKVRLIVAIVSPQLLSRNAQANRSAQAQPVLRSVPGYLLNGSIFLKSLRVALLPPDPPPPAGSAEWTPEQLRTRWPNVVRDYDANDVRTRLELLQRTMAPFRQRGVKLLLWAPPLRPDNAALFRTQGVPAVWEKITSQLQAHAPVVDLTYASEINGTPLRFKDPVHHQSGPLILEHLLREAGELQR